MADFSGILNPKRVIQKREEAAEAPAPAASSPSAPDARFGKPYTPAERAKQAEALKRFLAARGG